jgi:hypothetical protein
MLPASLRSDEVVGFDRNRWSRSAEYTFDDSMIAMSSGIPSEKRCQKPAAIIRCKDYAVLDVVDTTGNTVFSDSSSRPLLHDGYTDSVFDIPVHYCER